MDRILELLARLAELTAAELTELNDLIRAEFEALDGEPTTPELVEALDALAQAAEQVTGELARRDEAQAQLEEQRAAAVARLQPAAIADPEDDDTDDEVDPPAPDEAPTPEAVAAATRPALARLAARSRRRPARPAPDAGTASRTTIRDAAGAQLASRAQVAEAMAREIDATRGMKTAFRRVAVHAETQWPAERVLRRDDSGAGNDAIVAAALTDQIGQQALVAAGGLCAPVENLYDVNVVGVTARPVRDALPGFGADRGGVNLRQSPLFSDWAGAITEWTLQNDIDAATVGAPDPTKPIIEALCPGFTTFNVSAIPARVRFRNITSRFDPEGTRANLDALDVAWARVAENILLTKMAALSLQVTAPKVIGATRDLLATYDRLFGYLRSRFRLDDTVMLRAIMPRWVKDMVRADLTRGELSMEALAVADQQIEDWFSRRHVTPTWHLDGRSAAVVGPPAIAAQQYAAAVSGSAIPEFPDQVEALVYTEGDFLFLDGGELDLGVVRDASTNQVNAYEIFKETFEGLAYRGVPGGAVQLIATVDPNGLSAGRIDTTAISD